MPTFFAHDEPDFDGYCQRVRKRVGGLFPRDVRLVETQEEMRAALPGSPRAGGRIARASERRRLRAGSELRIVQKYGGWPRNIDTAACAAKGVKVLTIRRRANVACAELAFALMLTLAKKLHRLAGRISVEQLTELGYAYKPFDRRHTPNSNWPRISGPAHAQREYPRDHRPRRDRPRNRHSCGGFRHAHALLSAHAAAGGGGARARRQPTCRSNRCSPQSDWVVPQLPSGAGDARASSAARNWRR